MVQLGKKVETYSYKFEAEQFNQPFCDILEKYLGVKHNWTTIKAKDIENGLKTYSLYFNKPTNWPNYAIQTQKVCEKIRQNGFLHCHTGDGCDDIFLGYPNVHLRSKIINSPIKIPKWLLDLITSVLRWRGFESMFGHMYTVGLNVIRSLARDHPERGYLTYRVFDEHSINHMRVHPRYKQRYTIEEILSELTVGLKNLSSDRLAYLGKYVINPNWVKMIGSADSTGITMQSPYIHIGLMTFARNIPDDLCRPKEKTASKVTGKYILMKMAEEKKMLPPTLIYQRKFPAVDAPIDKWYAKNIRDTVLSTFRKLPFDYDQKFVGKLLKPKIAEAIYKKLISLDQLSSSHGPSLLATYASLCSALSD